MLAVLQWKNNGVLALDGERRDFFCADIICMRGRIDKNNDDKDLKMGLL